MSKTKPVTYINNHIKNSHVTISAISKDDSNINSIYETDKKSMNIKKTKKPARPFSTKSNNFPIILGGFAMIDSGVLLLLLLLFIIFFGLDLALL